MRKIIYKRKKIYFCSGKIESHYWAGSGLAPNFNVLDSSKLIRGFSGHPEFCETFLRVEAPQGASLCLPGKSLIKRPRAMPKFLPIYGRDLSKGRSSARGFPLFTRKVSNKTAYKAWSNACVIERKSPLQKLKKLKNGQELCPNFCRFMGETFLRVEAPQGASLCLPESL